MVIYTIAGWTVLQIRAQIEIKWYTFDFERIGERKRINALFRPFERKSSFRIENDGYSFNVDGIEKAMR